MDKNNPQPDAGLKSLDHYQRKLPPWRHWVRQKILPLVRWETPYLAWLQERMRTPALDTWFAVSANLGTHTFYMVMLPILFWCGHTWLGRGMVHLLASGVFFSGFLKDLLCLPRPLSPPLQRITMSGSAALEYGFPSTHSTNAVSVVVYAIHNLSSMDSDLSPFSKGLFQLLLFVYGTSIVLGRLYCGMHGFLDVIWGCLLGALLGFVQCAYGASIDDFVLSGSIRGPLIVLLIILVLVRIHPEPADSCPCFDDSVAFAGVLIGIEAGGWHFGKTGFGNAHPIPGSVIFDFQKIGWLKTILRVLLGIGTIFVWREVMKPSLLRFLPPLFRIIEKLGFSLPRRFFTQASEYQRVPEHLKDNDVIPNVSEIPSMLTSIRHPRRRAVSIGPQSEADAYETLAYREHRRRQSLSSQAKPQVAGSSTTGRNSNASISNPSPPARYQSPRPANRSPLRIDDYEHMMGTGTPTYEQNESNTVGEIATQAADYTLRPQGEKEMFSMITKPRVRYDVEVVTKLIVYSGIGLLAAEVNPILFYLLGLDGQ
ncbi:Long-chain base-1-phosphate phosphatase [Ophidiomyces ophidiicola]|nr:Long-chain base-1-phosphate phosphatase [Ophidiomyces ophidiicola]